VEAPVVQRRRFLWFFPLRTEKCLVAKRIGSAVVVIGGGGILRGVILSFLSVVEDSGDGSRNVGSDPNPKVLE